MVWWLARKASLKFFYFFFYGGAFFFTCNWVRVCFLFSYCPPFFLFSWCHQSGVFFFPDAQSQCIFIFLFLKAFMFSLEQLRNASSLPPESDSLNYLCSCLYLRRFIFICTFFLSQNSCKI